MVQILACVDHSAYANSVCDHAGWFASDPDVGVEVLHVIEARSMDEAGADRPHLPDPANALVRRAVQRLQDEGVGPITSQLAEGSFVQLAAGRGAEIIVMGKRGSHAGDMHRLGSSVAPIIEVTNTPVCLTSKLFLPIRRGLVLLDADLSHQAALQFIRSQPRLDGLPLDVVVMARPTEDATSKLRWARETVNADQIEVFSVQSAGIDQAVAQYSGSRAADLIIVSRAVLASDPELSIQRIEDRGLWGSRTSILVC